MKTNIHKSTFQITELASMLQQANKLHQAGKLVEASFIYNKILKKQHDNIDAISLLGTLKIQTGNHDEACVLLEKALVLSPDDAITYNNLGSALHASGRYEDALVNYKQATVLKPDYAEAYCNLGSSFFESCKFDKAVEAFNKAITIKPDYAKAHYNLGNTFKEQKNYDAAINSYRQAITIKPNYALAHNNLGTILQEQGKIDEADKCYNRAISLEPNYIDAHLSKAIISLLNGDFKSGWQEYEWRLQTDNYKPGNLNRPIWNGKPLNGKTILVHTEQGFGDTIQFLRYLPMVKAQGGRVIFECKQELFRLLKNYTGFDKIIEKNPSGKISVEYDVHAPLLSLPGLFKSTLETIPSGVPYITADPTLIDQWHLRLDGDRNFKIGIVWAGNPNHKKDQIRSCSLSDFAMLTEIPELSIYSLQKGHSSAEIDKYPGGEKIIRLDDEINDFADTAAIISNLDLVISVDTVVTHLAGAIGKPVWTLLPFVPDWRWLLNRNDSPWYPSMSLFRQARLNDWSGVFEQVKKALINNTRLRQSADREVFIDKGKDNIQETGTRKTGSEIGSSISLCMIVKNEEDNLERCLDSVRNVVDEMVIVDTGSTDKTIKIAEKYGARVFNHPWEGSFSKARNYSLKYATCDWILILDADEELNREDTHRLKEIAENRDYPAVSFIIKNKYKDSSQEGHAQMVRLYRNFRGVHYRGIVHNTIQYSGKCLYSPITIIHHGYNLSEDKMEKKFKRTSTLLKKQIESNPYNPVPHMYLGVAYMDRCMYKEAIAYSKKTMSLAEEKGFNRKDFLVSYYIVSAAYSEMKEFKDSVIYALMSIDLDNQFLDGYCLLAFAYYNLKKYNNFIDASDKYLTIWNKITGLFSEKKHIALHSPEEQRKSENELRNNVIYHTIGHKWKIHLLRGFYYFSSGQEERGKPEIEKAVDESTEMEYCFTLLGRFYIENNNIDKAEDAFRKLLCINEKSVNALFNLGHIKFKKNALNETLFFWKKAVEIEPSLFDTRLLMCKVNIVLGNFEDIVIECDQLLQILKMSRKGTIESLSDLGNKFFSIGDNLKKRDEMEAAETAYRISKELDRISWNAPMQYVNT
ncbi:hypothetical protein SCALIN_C05_0101 [Candidatus Scalindua japonica]|uniref:Glycosyltransferase 2-like domain-containing protein n=1 Tax=Candidatus Scalindua japonica TaxID=1284222 RepID=A0A286TVT6_9BACT|nr:tetratricopeptide repeat protein [Candidatus Scalindua japonica]GAX60016.1 hypothetical protein SCALIN_C05_0101 [Candidatus Scalindua japonica]